VHDRYDEDRESTYPLASMEFRWMLIGEGR